MVEISMLTLNKQKGASGLLVIIFIGMAAAILTVVFQLYPLFYENWQIEHVMESFEDETGLNDLTDADIEERFGKRLSNNSVRNFDMAESVYIVMEDGLLTIDLNYEVRVPIYRNVDAVVKFEKNFEKTY